MAANPPRVASTWSSVIVMTQGRDAIAGQTPSGPTKRPGWEETWQRYGNESWLTAKTLIEISPVLFADARLYTGWSSGNGRREADGTFHPDPEFQADRWLASVDEDGRGWSSTERRLFKVVASLLDSDRPVHLVNVLDAMGSWERSVWAALVQWGSGGDNRQSKGRLSLG
jgi:hypothetical protein